MNVSIGDQVTQVGQESVAIDPASLYKELEKVKDGRKKKGVRYPVAFVLTLILLGKLAGETTINGIRDWVDFRKEELKKLLGWPKKDFPSNKTYSDVLAKCDDKEVTELLAGIIAKARAVEKYVDNPSRLAKQREEDGKMNHIAADGKTLRGTLNHAKESMPSVHILTLYDCDTGITIQQYVYKNDESEVAASKEVLLSGLIKGLVVTTDSLYTYKEWCTWTHVCGAYYHTVVKKNTSALYENLEDYFNDEDILKEECEYFKKVEKGHGRLETREIWVSSQINEVLEKEWTGVAQVYMIRKTVIKKEEKKIIIRYGMTDIPREQADAERILELRRNHWRIENRSHYRRDVTLGEDACQVRINNAPEVLAALNGAILALMDFLGVKNVANKMRYYAAKPKEAIKLLCGNLLRQKG